MKLLLTLAAFSVSLAGRSQSAFTVYFDFNKYNLTAAAREKLDSFLRGRQGDAGAGKFEIRGHCDFIGTDYYNDKLSSQRVTTVKRYLLTHGLNESSIADAVAYGERKPLNENRTAAERQLNRRVEIVFVNPAESTMQTEPALNTEDKSLKEKLADSSSTVGTNIILRNINFIGGRHQLVNESLPALQELLDAMRTYPKLVIEIEGHICCQPYNDDGLDLETNIRNLSEARAKAVRDYLVANGIAPGRLFYRGFGHSRPLYPFPEQSEEERLLNRRVEIKIISK